MNTTEFLYQIWLYPKFSPNKADWITCFRLMQWIFRVVLWSGYAISLIWGEKRCVSDMFDINVFVLLVSGIVCFQSFVASNICELFLWQDKGIFFGEDILLTEYYIGCHFVGGKWNALFHVDNNVFVLQATQSINSPNLEASRLQVHFLQHVKLHVFGEDVFWRNTDF